MLSLPSAVAWRPTLVVHLIRSIAAGVVWSALVSFLDPGAAWWALPVALPCVYFVVLPIYLAGLKAAARFGHAGQALARATGWVLAIGIVVGDPLVALLHNQHPELVPLERMRLFHFVPVLFVTPPR